MEDGTVLWIGWAVAAAGSVMVLAAITVWLRRARVHRHGIEAQARVIEMQDLGDSESYDWRARVQFHTREGQLIDCVSRVGHYKQRYTAGEEIRLRYHAEDPRRVVLERDKWRFQPLVMLVFGMVLVAVGGGFIAVGQ